jgi:hypothetical protein
MGGQYFLYFKSPKKLKKIYFCKKFTLEEAGRRAVKTFKP